MVGAIEMAAAGAVVEYYCLMRITSLVLLGVLVSGQVAVADDETLTPIARHQTPPRRIEPDPGAKNIAITATIATGALALSAGLAYYHRKQIVNDAIDAAGTTQPESVHHARTDDAAKWYGITTGLAIATVVSASVTAYLWTQAQPRYEPVVAVDPVNGGGSLGVAGRF